MAIPNTITFPNPLDGPGESAEAKVEVYTKTRLDALVGIPAIPPGSNVMAEIINEIARAKANEGTVPENIDLMTAINNEKSRAEGAEQTIAGNLASEITNRASDVDAEETRAKAAEDLKLDKDSTAATYTRVYAVDHLGAQLRLYVYTAPLSGAIAQYDASGMLKSATPTTGADATVVTNKQYVDTTVAGLQQQINQLSMLGRFLGSVPDVPSIANFTLPALSSNGDYITVEHDSVHTTNNGSTRWKLVDKDNPDPTQRFQFDIAYDTDISGKISRIVVPEIGHLAVITSNGEIANGPDPTGLDTISARETALSGHANNTTMHTTSTEKSAWNAKLAKPTSSDVPSSYMLLVYDGTNQVLKSSGIDYTKVVTANAGLPYQILSLAADGSTKVWVDQQGGFRTGVVDTRADLPTTGDYRLSDYIFVKDDYLQNHEASMFQLTAKSPNWIWTYLFSFPGSGITEKEELTLETGTGHLILYRYGRMRQLLISGLTDLTNPANYGWALLATVALSDIPDIDDYELQVRMTTLTNSTTATNNNPQATPVGMLRINKNGEILFRGTGSISSGYKCGGIAVWFV